MELLEAVQRVIPNGSTQLERMVLSKPKQKSAAYRKMTVRPLLVRGELMYQLERFTEKQAFQENIEPDRLEETLAKSLQEAFSQLDAWDSEAESHILVSKKGKVLLRRKERAEELPIVFPTGQNRQKQYILPADNHAKPLVDLGVVTKEGKVAAAKYDKFKQINRFLEIISDSIGPEVEELSVVDFGCGKSYLTFILYDYLTRIRGIKAHIIGLDLKKDVIEDCNAIAKRYGYENLHFEVGNIETYRRERPIDMVITLHACDTATDYALYHAAKWQVKRIYSVPCCQHELNGQIQKNTAGSLTRHGLIKERFSALLTDALRADLLTAQGYKVDLLEFIDMEHSPKNLMIRAVKTSSGNAAAKQRVEEAMETYQVDPTLYRLFYGESANG